MPDNRTKKNRPEDINKEKVQQLRELTGEGMMCCLKALKRFNGDIEEAREYLRTLGNACRLYTRPL